MTKAIYTRTQLEPEMGTVKAQNFLANQAERELKRTPSKSRVVRVWSFVDNKKILEKVIIAS
jgi:hypothetical protein